MIMTMDIGGTKTMCAFWESGRLLEKQQLVTASIVDFNRVLSAQIKGRCVETLCIAAAGPVTGEQIELTNTGQRICRAALQKEFPQITEIVFLNDLEAVGYSLSVLEQSQIYPFKSGTVGRGAKAILSIGTGFGISAISKKGEVLPSEGGHMDFAPQDRRQLRLLDSLCKKHGHVSYERLLSGQGLVNIYSALTEESDICPKRITDQAFKGDPAAKETMTVFSQILGTACGSYGLIFMATGGIYLGGGIAPKILPLLDRAAFEEAYLRKGRFKDLLLQIPIFIIMDETAPSLGAAVYARLSAAV